MGALGRAMIIGIYGLPKAAPTEYTINYHKEKAMKCTSLEEVRDNIDRIDDAIIRLIAERTEYVRQAAAFKKSEEAVKAPDRVEAVIVKVRDKAEKYGASPEIAEAVYRNMINGFINMEMTEYKNRNQY